MSTQPKTNDQINENKASHSAPEWLLIITIGLLVTAAIWGGAVWLVGRLFH